MGCGWKRKEVRERDEDRGERVRRLRKGVGCEKKKEEEERGRVSLFYYLSYSIPFFGIPVLGHMLWASDFGSEEALT